MASVTVPVLNSAGHAAAAISAAGSLEHFDDRARTRAARLVIAVIQQTLSRLARPFQPEGDFRPGSNRAARSTLTDEHLAAYVRT